ncbi:MAG: ATP-dependent DNA helicase RecG [Bifidobacterium crudilactis]|uniref:ATP-dependent DNA helicase RecG n=1 Tax=Bifidobacterium crudilactis TaxID=327277 RepID=UPI003A5C6995
MSISLDTTVSSLMTNRRRVGALKSLGVLTVHDAITYYPFRVTDPVPLLPLRSITVGTAAAFAGVVRELRVRPLAARRGYRLEALVDDTEFALEHSVRPSSANLVFFSYKKHFVDWLSSRLGQGSSIVVQGESSVFNDRLQFTHPETLVIGKDVGTADEGLARVSRPRPVYHANSRISSEHIHESILSMLQALAESDETVGTSPSPNPDALADADERGGDDRKVSAEELGRAIPDIVPEDIRLSNGAMHRAEAIVAMHEPTDAKEFSKAIATLRYEEAFISQTALLRSREGVRATPGYACPVDEEHRLPEDFVASLPFDLTAGQHEVINAIQEDMAKPYPMQRLLQGEVGSGKTVVCVAAMLQAVDSGNQAVLVAPTQVLAEQHYQTISDMVQKLSVGQTAGAGSEAKNTVPVVLLTGGMRLAQRRKVLALAASGEPCIVIATHAAFSTTFQAPNLALVVIDEQHRFGVEQREALRRKNEIAPHLLIMTATPIPRTAALTWFGDLDISELRELPGGRKPIRTIVVQEADGSTMSRMFLHIRQRVEAGERAYIVCPRIDESSEAEEDPEGGAPMSPDDSEQENEAVPLHSVEEIERRLQALPQLKGLRIATLTGRDDDETKQQVMKDFAAGESPVLVATTVIEVGVDVPQASCIVVFDADRFGLSQLHQLRGRVGRGGTKSWAFFISRAEQDSIAAQRLAIIEHSSDGTEIAQADLELRGAGDVLGDAQSGGRSSLKLLRVVKDADVVVHAREQAAELLARDPELSHETILAGAVLDFIRGNEAFLATT